MRILKGQYFEASDSPPRTCRQREVEKPTLVVLHWTGAEARADTFRANLERRGLSVHYYIDFLGQIWQFADTLKTTCFHAGATANDLSVGIEVACRGTNYTQYDKTTSQYRDEGWVRYMDYTPRQVGTVLWLLERLADAYGIERRVWPTIDRGPEKITYPTKEDLDGFSGVIGHYQLTGRKTDPGPCVLRTLASFWGV